MSYKIFVETDNHFRVCCGEYEDFTEARNQTEKMIMDLFESAKSNAPLGGVLDEFIEEFPEEIASLIRSFETTGSASADFTDEGDTDNCHYVVTENILETYESENGMYFPEYSLQTNMLNMSGNEESYKFRLWSCLGDTDEGLTIRLLSAPFDL